MSIPDISVIVPIYNVEKYLYKCLDSIVTQTLQNIEIICVNDGSTDSSLEILNQFAQKDNRIKIIDKPNGGLVSARKAGVNKAIGNYVGFVDSDDWIEKDFYEKMLNAQAQTGADVVASDCFLDFGENSSVVKNKFDADVYKKDDFISNFLCTDTFFEYSLQPHIWSKLYRRELLVKIQNMVDERIMIGEDAAVVYPSVFEAESICITDICGYHYVQHTGSMTKVSFSDERERIDLLIAHLTNFLQKYDVDNKIMSQIEKYRKHLVFVRQMSELDENADDDKVLLPYGGISKDSRVIIYGAGAVGQKMHNYLSGINGINIVMWVDKNYGVYTEMGMDIKSPDKITDTDNYDYILIAGIYESVAKQIRQYLLNIDVDEQKIRWFSDEFING